MAKAAHAPEESKIACLTTKEKRYADLARLAKVAGVRHIGHPQLGVVPRHVWVVPAHPRQLQQSEDTIPSMSRIPFSKVQCRRLELAHHATSSCQMEAAQVRTTERKQAGECKSYWKNRSTVLVVDMPVQYGLHSSAFCICAFLKQNQEI